MDPSAILAVLTTPLLSLAPTTAGTLLVPGDYPTIQAAIDAAAPGDTVEVGPGTWIETIDFVGKDIHVRATGGPDVTTIEAPVLGGSVVSLVNGETSAAMLEGFRLGENNNADFAPTIRVSGASPVIRGCVIDGHEGFAIDVTLGDPLIESCIARHGYIGASAAVRLDRSDAEIRNCSFHGLGRTAIQTVRESSPWIHHTAIHDCPGGILTRSELPPGTPDSSYLRVERCVFARNKFDAANGYAIYLGSGQSASVTDCLFMDEHVRTLNSAGGAGYAGDELIFERNTVVTSFAWTYQVQVFGVETVVIRDNVLALDPGATPDGGGIVAIDYLHLTVENNTISGFPSATQMTGPLPGGSYSYRGEIHAFLGPIPYFGLAPSESAVSLLGASCSGCIQVADPLFVNRVGRDLHLTALSPCVDVGPTTGSTVDVDGDPRVVPYDYGADEVVGRSMWFAGDPLAGGNVRAVFQGQLGDPVLVGLATSLLPVPIATPFGPLELSLDFALLAIPGTIGSGSVLEYLFTVPALPTPRSFYAQPLIGLTLAPAVEFTWGG